MSFENVVRLNFLHHRMRSKDHNLSSREISERTKHTPLTSPLPNALACAQRGLFVRQYKNVTSPLVRGMRAARGERGVCALFVKA